MGISFGQPLLDMAHNDPNKILLEEHEIKEEIKEKKAAQLLARDYCDNSETPEQAYAERYFLVFGIFRSEYNRELIKCINETWPNWKGRPIPPVNSKRRDFSFPARDKV